MTASNELAQVPNFADREKWVLIEEGPLIYTTLGQEIGMIRKYRHRVNQSLIGFEEFISGDEKAFWKRWGLEPTSQMFHALRKKDSEGWVVGPPGSYWRSAAVVEGLALKGVWFFLFVPAREEAYGRYFPLPISRSIEPTEPPKKDAGI
ncbi:MAG TPA: hypothetical protein VNL14_21470 [Candidatus Acidoferrales bacterium]|nr:hypothetical protein [Candidatus Acidoferrales bacterium]